MWSGDSGVAIGHHCSSTSVLSAGTPTVESVQVFRKLPEWDPIKVCFCLNYLDIIPHKTQSTYVIALESSHALCRIHFNLLKVLTAFLSNRALEFVKHGGMSQHLVWHPLPAEQHPIDINQLGQNQYLVCVTETQ